jgi:hypothetical protein
MEFFKSDDGRPHGGRLLGTFYIFALLTALLFGITVNAMPGSAMWDPATVHQP